MNQLHLSSPYPQRWSLRFLWLQLRQSLRHLLVGWRSRMAALDEPLFVTVADEPGEPVVTEPTAMVAAAPVAPVAPTSPRGMAKSKVAAPLVPLFVTVADEPGEPVVTVPTAMVAAVPWLQSRRSHRYLREER